MVIHKDLQELLNELNEIGESVIFGGYLRDLRLNRIPNDADIATNIPIDIIEERYKNMEKASRRKTISGHDVFSFKLHKTEKIFVEIVSTTSNLLDKAKLADYTINSLLYGKDGIIDLEGFSNDFDNKIIREVNIDIINDDLKTRPYLWLKTLRLAAMTGFDLSANVFKALTDNKNSAYQISDEIMQTEGHKTLNGKGVLRTLKSLSLLGFIGDFDLADSEVIRFEEKEYAIQPHQKLCLLAVLIGKEVIDDYINFYKFTDVIRDKYEELYAAFNEKEKLANRLKNQVITIKKILGEK